MLVAVVLSLALFGWPLLRPLVASRLSAALGRTVTIASLRRDGGSLLRPVLIADELHIAQPTWAGPGKIASVERVLIKLPLIPLLTGHFRPITIILVRPQLRLYRAANGRLNWTDNTSTSVSLMLGDLRISDGQLDAFDAKSDRALVARFTLDRTGFRLLGRGRLGRQPLLAIARGAPIDPAQPTAAWPFRASFFSPRVTLIAAGVADHPLGFGHFKARIASHGHDLHDLDKVIEAGLPGTQAFTLRGDVRHDASDWALNDVSGTLGRSDFAGRAQVRQRNGRTLVNAVVQSQKLDFKDLSTDEGLAKGDAHFRRLGPRLLPETAINLAHLRTVDATATFVAHRLLFAKPSPFVSLAGTARLDHGVLTVQPLVAGLVHGRIIGWARVDHRTGKPHLSLDLRLIDSRVENVLVKPADAVGAMRGRLRLNGDGQTVRQAVGRSSGTLAFIVTNGSLPTNLAELIGQDAGGVVAGKERVDLRCAVAHFSVRKGIASPSPLLIDTAVSQATASGSIDLSSERIALAVAGRRKQGSAVRLAGPLKVSGILSKPIIGVAAHGKSPKGIFKAIGHALFGGGGDAPAVDANCAQLAIVALK